MRSAAVKHILQCLTVCFLTAVLRLDPTRPDGFFSAGRLQTRQAAVQPPVLSCCRRYCSLTARLQLSPACAHKLCTLFRLEMNRQCRFQAGAVCAPVCCRLSHQHVTLQHFTAQYFFRAAHSISPKSARDISLVAPALDCLLPPADFL